MRVNNIIRNRTLISLTMRTTAYITVLIITGVVAVNSVFAKNKQTPILSNRHFSIGFNTGIITTTNKSISLTPSTQTKAIVLGAAISKQMRLEAGVTWFRQAMANKNNYRQYTSFLIPISANYYLLPKKSRFQPYLGIGASYYRQFTGVNYESNQIANGLNKMSIMFTQGFTIEVNTKINITQSLHLIATEEKKTIGLSIGIGFKLP